MRNAYSNDEQILIKEYLAGNELEKFELNDDDFRFIEGATVLIIGIGNRIGHELLEILRDRGVDTFVLLDGSEKSLYDVVEYLEDKPFLNSKIYFEIGDIGDEKWLRSIFEVYKPTVCYNFAAKTSVRLSNVSPESFISTNICGTLNILNAAAECPTMKVCIFISSDKANAPTSVYGVTNFILDFLVRQTASHHPRIRFGTLQLVNICSTGGSYFLRSLIQRVKYGKQIRIRLINGQIPKRRFSTPKTAAKLFLKFSAFCQGGHAFGIWPESVAPIDVKSLAMMVCRELGVEDVETYMQDKFNFVDSQGESVEEIIPDGAYRVPGIPLYLTPPTKVNEVWFWDKINKLIVLSSNIRHREEVMKIINLLGEAAVKGIPAPAISQSA